MEDEHVCIDDLVEHLGATANLTSPGAFYGVCKLVLLPYIELVIVNINRCISYNGFVS